MKPLRRSPPALGPPPAPEALHRARGQCSGSFDSLFELLEILALFSHLLSAILCYSCFLLGFSTFGTCDYNTTSRSR